MKSVVPLFLSLFFSIPSWAAVLDFEPLAWPTTYSFPFDYEEDGFLFEPITGFAGFSVLGTTDDRYAGSTTLAANSENGVTRLSRVDGDFFSLASIDLAEAFSGEQPIVTFVANTGASQSFTLDGVGPALETFFFNADFQNILSVTWTQGRVSEFLPDIPLHQFDNIVVSQVPLPGAFGLFVMSGIMFLFCRRRLNTTF